MSRNTESGGGIVASSSSSLGNSAAELLTSEKTPLGLYPHPFHIMCFAALDYATYKALSLSVCVCFVYRHKPNTGNSECDTASLLSTAEANQQLASENAISSRNGINTGKKKEREKREQRKASLHSLFMPFVNDIRFFSSADIFAPSRLGSTAGRRRNHR